MKIKKSDVFDCFRLLLLISVHICITTIVKIEIYQRYDFYFLLKLTIYELINVKIYPLKTMGNDSCF